MSSRNEIVIYLGCDTLVSVGKDKPLYDHATDPPVAVTSAAYPGATVAGVLKDKDGNVLGGGISFSYVAGSTAQWDGLVADDYADLVLNMRGTLEVTANVASGKLMLAELNFLVARYQGEA